MKEMGEMESNIDYYAYIQDAMEELSMIRADIITAHDLQDFDDIINYHVKMRGKSLRPSLCLMVTDALGGNHKESLYFAAGVEFVHSASLIHDDIVDGDTIRRGMKSVHTQFDVKRAILFGDVTASLSFDSVLSGMSFSHGIRAGKEFVRAVNKLARGAAIEHATKRYDEKSYLNMLSFKTGTLFQISSRLGALASNVTDATEIKAASLGESIGMAFQITDDVTDIIKSKRFNRPEGDMIEGKVSLPILRLYDTKPEYRTLIDKYYQHKYKAINKEVKGLNQEEFETLIGALYDTDAISYTQDMIKFYTIESKKQILEFPSNDYTAGLFNFAEFACDALVKEANK